MKNYKFFSCIISEVEVHNDNQVKNYCLRSLRVGYDRALDTVDLSP